MRETETSTRPHFGAGCRSRQWRPLHACAALVVIALIALPFTAPFASFDTGALFGGLESTTVARTNDASWAGDGPILHSRHVLESSVRIRAVAVCQPSGALAVPSSPTPRPVAWLDAPDTSRTPSLVRPLRL